MRGTEKERRGKGHAARNSGGRRVEGARVRGRKKNYFLHYLVFSVFALVAVTAMCFTVFFNIEVIEIAGETGYTQEEIMAAVTAEEGQNLLRINTEKISKGITESLLLIDTANVEIKLPNKLIITVSPAKVYLSYYDGGYYSSVSRSGKVLYRDLDNRNPDNILVTGVSSQGAMQGEYLSSYIMGGEQNLAVMELAKCAEEKELYAIREIDVTDISNIEVRYGSGIVIKIGDADKLEEKMSMAATIIKIEGEDAAGTVDVTVVEMPGFRPRS